ncbi:unnamed protein product [Prunus brigantina]
MALINNLLPTHLPLPPNPPPPLLLNPIPPMLSGTNKTNLLLATSPVHSLSPFSLSLSVAPLPGISGSVSNATSLNLVWPVNLLFVFNSWICKKALNPLMLTFVMLSLLPIHWLPSMNLSLQNNLSLLCFGV